jgi:Leucine-rich repeat (LRR) protein
MDIIYELISKPISEWLKEKYGIVLSEKIITGILFLIGVLITYLVKILFSHIKKVINQKNSKSLHPYFNHNEIINAKKNYITQKFQNVPPSKEDELIYTHSSVAKQKLIKFFIKSFSDKSDKRFFVLLADSGMGKTTFSLNLYRKYNSYIRFLFKKNKYNIALIPLGYDSADEHINNLKQNGNHLNTILILDALDEDNNAIVNSINRLKNIVELTKEFRFVIITCRTQFFNNENLEPKATNIPRLGTKKGFYNFEKLYLSPFTNKDVIKYINKKYGFLNIFSSKKKKAKEIINSSPYLMARPMLLDFIEDIANSNKDFKYTFNVYESLIDSWLERETFNVSQNKKFTYKNDLLKISTEISKEIYNNRKQLGYTISQIQFDEIARVNNLDLTLFEMKTRSLLNRNPEGDFKFSHKSVLEYFLSLEIYKDVKYKKLFDEEGMDMTMNFYDELCYLNDFLPYYSSNNFKKNIKIFQENLETEIDIEKNEPLKITKIIIENFKEKDLRAIRCFKNINSLIIKNSEIETLEDINCFKNLNNLEISNSKVTDFKRINELNGLIKLSLIEVNLFDYQINEINWSKLDNLIYLNISNNSISSFSECLKSKNIKILNASNNKITYFTTSSSLESLDLSNNKLVNLELFNLNLKNLNVSFNDINSFKLTKNTSLIDIDLSNNKLKKINFDDENKVQILSLSNNKFDESVFNDIHICSDLKNLDLQHNKIKTLENISTLNKLKLLNITDTRISEISIDNLPISLKEIHVSKIKVEEKMNSIFKFSKDGHVLKRK